MPDLTLKKKPLFLVFEGGEGSGKSTQSRLLADYLKAEGYDVLLTKEPGGDDGPCARIREILLAKDHSVPLSAWAEFFLFEADRSQHVRTVIDPALKAGKIVVCDRFDPATFAYQCFARKLGDWDLFSYINQHATDGITPDFVFWCDVPPEIGLQRNKEAKKRDRFESEDIEFHRKVRMGYQQYFEHFPRTQWVRIDSTQPLNHVSEEIMTMVKKLIFSPLIRGETGGLDVF